MLIIIAIFRRICFLATINQCLSGFNKIAFEYDILVCNVKLDIFLKHSFNINGSSN